MKFEIFYCFVKFKTMVENIFFRIIKSLQIDEAEAPYHSFKYIFLNIFVDKRLHKCALKFKPTQMKTGHSLNDRQSMTSYCT